MRTCPLADAFCGISVLDEERLISGEGPGDDESAFVALPLEIRGKDASPVKTIATTNS